MINNSVEFWPAYTTSLIYTEGGKFLNVILKSKILETKTIYDYNHQSPFDTFIFKNK